jgi:hypothetical protein
VRGVGRVGLPAPVNYFGFSGDQIKLAFGSFLSPDFRGGSLCFPMGDGDAKLMLPLNSS